MPVIFVPGGARMWGKQKPLAKRWRLVYAGRPPAGPGGGFEAEAAHVAGLLGEGAHLVGHGSGGIVALLAAARQPAAVWSLTVIEPPLSQAAAGEPGVAALEQALAELADNPPTDPAEHWRTYLKVAAPSTRRPPALAAEAAELAAGLRGRAWPARVALPVDTLIAAPGPKLFVSGGHSPAQEAICDALALLLGGARKVLPGAGHMPQRLGEPFNELLEALMRAQPLP